MPSSILATLAIIFIPSILLSFPAANAASSSSLIEKVCSSTKKYELFSYKTCKKVLKSDPRLTSTTNMFDLSVGIMKSGITRATRTRNHIESLLEKNNNTSPSLQTALQECKQAYTGVVGSTKSALGEVEIKEYMTATYDLKIASTDDIQRCEGAVASQGIKDEIILKGNKLVLIFGFSALEAVDMISTHF